MVAPRATKHHSSFNQLYSSSSVCLIPCNSLPFSPISCKQNRYFLASMDAEKDQNKSINVMRTGGLSLVFGASTVLGMPSGGGNCKWPSKASAADHNSNYNTEHQNDVKLEEYSKVGKDALKSLLGMSAFLVKCNQYSKKQPHDLPQLPEMPDARFIDKELKVSAWRLIKDGKADETAKKLKEYFGKIEDSDPKYELDMALIEILIFQGKYEEALKRESLNENKNKSDARYPLYKAIIYSMLDKYEEAKQWWEKFSTSIKESPLRDIPIQPFDNEPFDNDCV